jgi:lipopolysaccharide biosynthesis glycosyltransferase
MEAISSSIANCTVNELPITLNSGSRSHPIVMACDERYAMPLAVTLRSMAEANRSERAFEIVILTDEFSSLMKSRVEASVPEGKLTFHWVQVDLARFADCSGMLAHTSKLTYARLLLPYVLPQSVEKVLYLDSDILVLDDLQTLLRLDLQGSLLGAVVDLDSSENAERLGLKAQGSDTDLDVRAPESRGKYFNAGVLLVDLASWRDQQISEKAMQYLSEYPHAPLSDQDALNVVCAAQWKPLDSRWNAQKHEHGAHPGEWAGRRAAIVHFCGSSKPWIASRLPASGPFYDEYRARTRFARTKTDKIRDIVQAVFTRVKRTIKQVELVSMLHAYFRETRATWRSESHNRSRA